MATDNGRSSHEFASGNAAPSTVPALALFVFASCLVGGLAWPIVAAADSAPVPRGSGPAPAIAGARTDGASARSRPRHKHRRVTERELRQCDAARRQIDPRGRAPGTRRQGHWHFDPRRPASGEPDVQAPGSGGAAGEAATTPPSSPVPDDPTAATAPLSESRDRLDRRAGDRPTRDSEAAVPTGSHDRRAPAAAGTNRCPPSRCLRPVPTAPARPLAATVARRPRVRRTSGPVVPSGLDPHPSRPSRRANGPILVQTPIRARRLRVGGHPSRGRTVASAGRSRCRPSR